MARYLPATTPRRSHSDDSFYNNGNLISTNSRSNKTLPISDTQTQGWKNGSKLASSPVNWNVFFIDLGQLLAPTTLPHRRPTPAAVWVGSECLGDVIVLLLSNVENARIQFSWMLRLFKGSVHLGPTIDSSEK